MLADTGFQGYAPPGIRVLLPRKKPRGHPLEEDWKRINQGISRLRVRVEHAIAGVKRCRIVADPFDFAQGTAIYRNFKAGFKDAVMLSACGLHHLRVSCRSAS